MSPYKKKRKQKKFQREYKWAIRHGTKFVNPFKGMEAIGKEKIKRKSTMLPVASRNGRKKGTWLREPPKHTRPPKRTGGVKRKSSFRGGV
jgi:hypothetical protein